MFDKLLIANRGEIACRIIRTARRMGIATVAVYSEADRDALHVQMADQAVAIGPAPAAQSYLSIDRIVDACRATHAQAVHPGYGFLSENAAFAQRLEAEGIVFIGPTSHAITAMGDKISAKTLAQKAGVHTVPGYFGSLRDTDHAVQIANEIGYPVMIKASAGGGGKGMRLAWNDDETRSGFDRAGSEAKSAFGDDRLFIEKFIQHPRHIEIQVIGDTHGTVLSLGERECSLQRRHQKVIEEAPSPLLDAATRKDMCEQAVAVAQAVKYTSAGTVEFIVDPDRNFYFLEMNTRLQVEHPVTEFVTDLDLVELMIRVAAGEKLPLSQSQVQLRGHAIEVRVYAEDPFRNFLPSIGRLVRYMPPTQGRELRVDTGVFEGGEVSMYYDPMIAKLIAYGHDRATAIKHLRHALNEFYIRGVQHNISFLAALVDHPRFIQGDLSTDLIATEYPEGFNPSHVVHDDPALLIVVAATLHRRYMDRAALITGQMTGHERIVQDAWVVMHDHTQHPVLVHPPEHSGCNHVIYQKQNFDVQSDWQFGQPLFRGKINGRAVCIQVERRNLVYRLFHWGAQRDFMVLSQRAAELYRHMPVKPPPDLSKYLTSPMPGLLTQLLVREGEEVKAGQHLAIIEAMKMENILTAAHDTTVAKTLAAVGDSLVVDQPILEFAVDAGLLAKPATEAAEGDTSKATAGRGSAQ